MIVQVTAALDKDTLNSLSFALLAVTDFTVYNHRVDLINNVTTFEVRRWVVAADGQHTRERRLTIANRQQVIWFCQGYLAGKGNMTCVVEC